MIKSVLNKFVTMVLLVTVLFLHLEPNPTNFDTSDKATSFNRKKIGSFLYNFYSQIYSYHRYDKRTQSKKALSFLYGDAKLGIIKYIKSDVDNFLIKELGRQVCTVDGIIILYADDSFLKLRVSFTKKYIKLIEDKEILTEGRYVSQIYLKITKSNEIKIIKYLEKAVIQEK